MKLLSSRTELKPIVSQETGTIWDYLKTTYRNYGRPNPDGSVTFYSDGIRKILGNYYEFKFERTFEVTFESQSDYDKFINVTLIELDEMVFAAYGDSSDAEILD
jgi:hypothetical protein